MGIQGLATQLRKYGRYRSILRSEAGAGDRIAAVIDGPSLAHSILRVTTCKLAKDGIVPLYDYDVLGKAAVAWLDRLRAYGFNM